MTNIFIRERRRRFGYKDTEKIHTVGGRPCESRGRD